MANPQGLDISSILAAGANFQQGVASGAVGLQKNAASQETLTQSNADLLTTIGTNAVIIDAAQKQSDLVLQQTKNAGATALQTNLKVQSEYRDHLVNTILTEGANYDSLLKKVEEKSSISLLDNPVGWILANLTVDDDKAAADATGKRLSAAKQQMLDLNTITQSQSRTQTELAEPITAASIKASADNISLVATQKANEERIKGITYNSEGIKAALNADAAIMQNQYSMFGAQKAQEQAEIALAQLERARQEFDWKKAEKEKGEQADAYLIDKINKGAQLRLGEGYVPIPYGSVKANQIISLIKSNSPAGKQFLEDYQIAEQSEMTGTRVLAPSPARAIDMLNTMPVKLSPAMTPVKRVLDQALGDAQTAAQIGKLDIKNKEAVQAFLNKRSQELIDSQAVNIKPGDADNVFQIPGLRELISNSPTLQKLPLVDKVIAPAIAAGADLSNPDLVFSAVVQAIRDRKISYAEALDLTTIYHTGVNTTLAARQLTSVGLVPRYSYNTSITTNPAGVFGGREVIDLTKPDRVGRAINKLFALQVSTDLARDPTYGLNPFVIGSNIAIGEAAQRNSADPRSAEPVPQPGMPPNIYETNPDYWNRYRQAQQQNPQAYPKR